MATTIPDENTQAIAALTTAVASLQESLSAEVIARQTGDAARPTTSEATAIANTAVNAVKLTGTYDLKTNDDIYTLLAAVARKLGATVNE